MKNNDYTAFIDKLLDKIKTNKYIFSEDLPNIDLYMDQVTTFMNSNLGIFRRDKDEKIFTKTMINNYSKCDILPPSDKKKYDNEHMILLLFVYYFKQVLSIDDIKVLLETLKTNIGDHNDLSEVYDKIISTQLEYFDTFSNQVNNTVNVSKDLFKTDDEDTNELLSIFTTAYLLSIQASAHKYIITSLIDSYLKKAENKKETPKTVNKTANKVQKKHTRPRTKSE